MKTDSTEQSGKKISRQEALKKAGKYAAFTAAAAIILLAPKEAQADSLIEKPGGGGWGSGGDPVAPPGGGDRIASPFTKPDSKENNSGLRDSPWK